MNIFEALAAWGLVVGVVVGVILHFSVSPAKRASVVKWCFTFGAAMIAFVVGAEVSRGHFDPDRGIIGLAFVGLPALVAGIVVLALGRTTLGRGKRGASDV